MFLPNQRTRPLSHAPAISYSKEYGWHVGRGILECAIWGSVILSQFGIIAVLYVSAYPFLKRFLGF